MLWRDSGLRQPGRLQQDHAFSLLVADSLVYKIRIRDVDHLKERLVEEWAKFDQKIIDASISQWRKRLRACVAADGGHFEHSL